MKCLLVYSVMRLCAYSDRFTFQPLLVLVSHRAMNTAFNLEYLFKNVLKFKARLKPALGGYEGRSRGEKISISK